MLFGFPTGSLARPTSTSIAGTPWSDPLSIGATDSSDLAASNSPSPETPGRSKLLAGAFVSARSKSVIRFGARAGP